MNPAACVPIARRAIDVIRQVIANVFVEFRRSRADARETRAESLWRTELTVNILARYADAPRQSVAVIAIARRCPERCECQKS